MRQVSEQRRLLAIVVADIVGYSRLMAEHEAETFHRLKDLQSSLIVPVVAANNGQIVKWTGDGFIASFGSAVDAVRAAVEMQSGASTAGVSSAEERRIQFRMGVHVGDVIVVPGDVYGDAVNLASRLESIAPVGGICVSRAVRDTVRGKFAIEFEDKGEVEVKNIPDPVGAFHVRFQPIGWTAPRAPPSARGRLRPVLAIAASAALVGLSAGGTWWLAGREPSPPPVSSKSAVIGAQNPATPIADALAERFAKIAPRWSPETRLQQAREYEAAQGHKAQAVSPQSQEGWRSANRPSAENAEDSSLESCQIRYGRPCALLAVNDRASPIPNAAWPVRDMPRVSYAGLFDPERIPGASPASRQRREITGYAAAPNPKAASFHPVAGAVFVVTSAPSQRAAEELALAACANDPNPDRKRSPCFLYAVGDRVVLPSRRTGPMTEAAAPPPQGAAPKPGPDPAMGGAGAR